MAEPGGRAARVLVTRPQPEADRWVLELAARGLAAQALPLIQIGPAVHTAQHDQVVAVLGEFRALMFVSGAAVAHFLVDSAQIRVAKAVDAGLRLWTTGPGTTRALVQRGCPKSAIDSPSADSPQFDSEALWAVVRHRVHTGDGVLIVRGGTELPEVVPDAGSIGSGRDWLACRLQEAGVRVEFLAVYRRLAPVWDGSALASARAAAADGSVWVFTSSEAVGHLATAWAGQDWSAARAVATHPRVAMAARRAGFGTVRECGPGLDAVVASIESLA